MKIFTLFVLTYGVTSALATTLIPRKESRVLISIPYTMGTHEVEGKEFSGTLNFDEKTSLISEGRFTLGVDKITGEKATLICHLNEALTLDYEKSDFPEDHVCEDDKLPTEGKNAPVHREIEAQLLEPVSLDATRMKVRWTIHGVSREQEIPVAMKWDNQNKSLTIDSKFTIKRKDYDVTVKKFLFIGVDEHIPLKVSLVLGEK